MENLLLIVFVVLISFFILITINFIYQLLRNEKVYKIRGKWIDSGDCRHYKYSYDEMFKASARNLFGLKYPNEKDFK